jgi:hypothetical protein
MSKAQRNLSFADRAQFAPKGSTTFGPASQIGYKTWPLGTGNYEIRLLLDDGYRLAAASPQFKIVQP